MKRRVRKLRSLAFCLVLSAAAGIAQGSGESARIGQIKTTIAIIRSGKTVDARTGAAEHLARLTQKVSSEEVTETPVSYTHLCGASPGRVAAETATRGRMIRFRRFRFSALTGGTFRRLKRARRIRAYGFLRLSSATLSKTRHMRALSLIRTSTSFLPGNRIDP